jgi:hypothetical protein
VRWDLDRARRARGPRENSAQRARRQSRPTVGGCERLESRILLHSRAVTAPIPVEMRAHKQPAEPPHTPIENALAVAKTERTLPGRMIATPDATIFLPTGLVPGRTYPVVVAFAYNGSPSVPLSVWLWAAEEYQWIVIASKDYTNAVFKAGLPTVDAVASRVQEQINTYAATLPIDMSRLVFSGMSGGANFAEFMNLRYPGYAAGIVINSGEIPTQFFRRTPTPGYLTMPSASDFGASRRVAVFLCSPSDSQFYGISHANERTMHGLGWDTLFLNFPGGHRNAPVPTYLQALAWVVSQPAWTANAPTTAAGTNG